MKKLLILFTAAALALQGLVLPASAAEESEPVSCGMFYDADGTLIGARNFTGNLSYGDMAALSQVYRPDGAESFKLYTSFEGRLIEFESLELGERGDDELCIITTNDMHGYMSGDNGSIPIDRIASLKKMTHNVLLLDAGNAVQGQPYASLTRGEDAMITMNVAGYDGMVLGNHEFDYGFDQLYTNTSVASFPVLSANTVFPEREDGKVIKVNDSHMYDVNGKKVGVFGITTSAPLVSPEANGNITFKDEIETAKEQVSILKDMGADIIIALTHLGVNDNAPCTSYQLADAMRGSGLDLIVDGHSHSMVVESEETAGVPIIQGGAYSQRVGFVSFDFDSEGNSSIRIEDLLTPEFFKNIPSDEKTANFIKATVDEQKELLETPVGYTNTTLWGGDVNDIPEGRIHETNLGDFVCDCMIEEANQLLPEAYANIPVVAVENGGGLDATIDRGEITWGEIINVLPFSNFLKCKDINPSILYKMLEHAVSAVNSQDTETGLISSQNRGFFLQVGGMSFEYDPNKPVGSRINAVYLDGQNTALDRNDTTTPIILAANDFIITGGDGYEMLKDIPMLVDGGGFCEMLIAALKPYSAENPFDYPLTQGRIRLAGSYEPKSYTAHAYLLNPDNVLVQNKSVTIYVDGEEREVGSDAMGMIEFEVSDGPHVVSLDNMTEIYVNNYSGNGCVETGGINYSMYPVLTVK